MSITPITEKKPAFHAYPGKPIEIAQTIRAANSTFNAASGQYKIEEWEKNDISGIPLTTPIFSKIITGAFLAADVTCLNENVAFEIGYAIGSKKRVHLFVNSTHTGDQDLASNIGIFDTLGHERYENAQTLATLLLNRNDFPPIDFELTIPEQGCTLVAYSIEGGEDENPPCASCGPNPNPVP